MNEVLHYFKSGRTPGPTGPSRRSLNSFSAQSRHPAPIGTMPLQVLVATEDTRWGSETESPAVSGLAGTEVSKRMRGANDLAG